jgi:hypothetical protein
VRTNILNCEWLHYQQSFRASAILAIVRKISNWLHLLGEAHNLLKRIVCKVGASSLVTNYLCQRSRDFSSSDRKEGPSPRSFPTTKRHSCSEAPHTDCIEAGVTHSKVSSLEKWLRENIPAKVAIYMRWNDNKS